MPFPLADSHSHRRTSVNWSACEDYADCVNASAAESGVETDKSSRATAHVQQLMDFDPDK